MKKSDFPSYHPEFDPEHLELKKGSKLNPKAVYHHTIRNGSRIHVFHRIEDSPVYDPKGERVYYGQCSNGCGDTEDRGIITRLTAENKYEHVQLHYCYDCGTTNGDIIPEKKLPKHLLKLNKELAKTLATY